MGSNVLPSSSVVTKLGLSAGYAFACENTRGAILNCARPHATARDLDDNSCEILRQYMQTKYDQWRQENPGVPVEDIVLVTGTEMTRDWEAAVWSSRAREYGGDFGLSAGGILSGKASVSMSTTWRHGVEYSNGHNHPGVTSCSTPNGPCYADGGEPTENQCIFVRGCWYRTSKLRAPRAIKAAAEPKPLSDGGTSDSADEVLVVNYRSGASDAGSEVGSL